MRITQHPSNNAVLGAPDGMSHDQCRSAPITRVKDSFDDDYVVTYWQPTPAEMRAVAAGAKVRITVMGRTMPPMRVGVDTLDDTNV